MIELKAKYVKLLRSSLPTSDIPHAVGPLKPLINVRNLVRNFVAAKLLGEAPVEAARAWVAHISEVGVRDATPGLPWPRSMGKPEALPGGSRPDGRPSAPPHCFQNCFPHCFQTVPGYKPGSPACPRNECGTRPL